MMRCISEAVGCVLACVVSSIMKRGSKILTLVIAADDGSRWMNSSMDETSRRLSQTNGVRAHAERNETQHLALCNEDLPVFEGFEGGVIVSAPATRRKSK